MAREFFVPNHGAPKIETYSDIDHGPQSPVAVIRGTASAMDVYFNSYMHDTEYIRSALSGDTLDLLRRTELGFARNLRLIDRLRLMSPERRRALIDEIHPFFMNEGDENEAFGTALVTFSFMPEMTHIYPWDFSRKGNLEPPSTTQEYYGRIRELKDEVVKIVAGQTDPHEMSANFKAPLVRTYLFFLVGSEIPLKMPETPKEARSRVNEILEDTEVDL